jgi:hypothetical protein
MWNLVKTWLESRSACGVARRRQRAQAGTHIEGLELRQLLSATSGIDHGVATATHVVQDGKAVPRIAGVAGDYTFFDGPGTLTITQDGSNIHGVITADHNPSGTFDASFKKPQSKVAKGTGSFLFQGDEISTPVSVTFKFKSDHQGGFNFKYHYKEIRA